MGTDSPALAPPGEIGALALRRLQSRLVGEGAEGFLVQHRAVVGESLTGALRNAFLAIELALHDRMLWQRLAKMPPAGSAKNFLSQVQSLRLTFLQAGLGEG